MSAETATPELMTCRECGKGGLKGQAGIDAHWNLQCPKHPRRIEFDVRKTTGDQVREGNVISRRGMARRGFDTQLPTPLEQIRSRPGWLIGGPAAYFINPKGATIREIILIRPNGAPMLRNGSDIAISMGIQKIMAARGYEYVGPMITTAGAHRLVEIMEANRVDYTLDLKEQIADVNKDIDNSDRPEVRDNQRTRKIQLMRLLAQTEQPFDADALVKEMEDIVKAQKLAALDPAIREAISAFVDTETDRKVSLMVEKLTGGKRGSGEGGFTVSVSNVAEGESF